MAILHELRQVGVRGGNDPDIDLDGAAVANTLQLSFLQHPQQLGLEGDAHGADLVEEEGAAVRDFETTGAVGDRTGKSAPHVTEELGFQEVQRDEPMRASTAVVVYRSRGQLLASAGLAGHQHSAGTGRDGLEQIEEFPHPSAAAHEPFESIAVFQL